MTKQLPHVVILGAGPAGVGAAHQLASKGIARVTVLEQQERVGGNAGSFEIDGLRCDFGSHRLHAKVPPEIMHDIKRLLGDDLLFQKRRGRILLHGRWIGFPLKPIGLLTGVPKSFALSVAGDMAKKAFSRSQEEPKSFAEAIERGLGPTMCREFYFPYARKLWGVAPEDLSPVTAQRRVAASSFGKLLRKVANQIPGLKPPGAGGFYYPRRGFGQISESLYQAAQAAGAEFKFGARFTSIEREGAGIRSVRYQHNGEDCEVATSTVWSTIPVSILLRGIRPEPPADVLASASSIPFRGMILIYLALDADRYTNFDAYYFPEASIPISRLSEPKNFSSATEPRGRTVLCAELPSDPGCEEWELSDEELGRRLCKWIEQTGLPKLPNVAKVLTRRLRQAYPVYRRGFEEHFERIDRWIPQVEGLLTFGRQGLFAHDNTHHTLAMAYAAAACLGPDGKFDRARWMDHRKEFESHVVED
jgi:protoporphyrinogen oxidase